MVLSSICADKRTLTFGLLTFCKKACISLCLEHRSARLSVPKSPFKFQHSIVLVTEFAAYNERKLFCACAAIFLPFKTQLIISLTMGMFLTHTAILNLNNNTQTEMLSSKIHPTMFLKKYQSAVANHVNLPMKPFLCSISYTLAIISNRTGIEPLTDTVS